MLVPGGRFWRSSMCVTARSQTRRPLQIPDVSGIVAGYPETLVLFAMTAAVGWRLPRHTAVATMTSRISQQALGPMVLALVAMTLALLVAAPAHAIRFRRPFNIGVGLGYGFDNRGGAGCTDYNCGSRCYDGHTGMDFPTPLGTAIVAVAEGTVTATNQGCADYGSLGNTCGGRCGNYVRIRHDDGNFSLYCHLQNGSVRVGVNQRVGCGQHIGNSASSGSSTGPHLHLGWIRGGTTTDGYAGGCTSSPGNWVDQRGYHETPSEQCATQCECSPGQSETRGCGRCGNQRRTCEGNCRWGGWSGCGGEGPCSPGQSEREACCDCGERGRTCNGGCQWDGWSACNGPDPEGGSLACQTGRPGVCADGAVRCVAGCRACIERVPASDERCDDLDNDCDGAADEGTPPLDEANPPAFGALLIDASLPTALRPNEAATAWLTFRNVGTASWMPWQVALAVQEAAGQSAWWDEATWLAWDVLTAVEEATEPGDDITLSFVLRAGTTVPDGPLALVLQAPDGRAMACPSPGIDLQIALLPSASEPAVPAAVGPPRDDDKEDAGGLDAPADTAPSETGLPEPGLPDAAGADATAGPDTAADVFVGSDSATDPVSQGSASPPETRTTTTAGCSSVHARGAAWSLLLLALVAAARRRRS